jgi:hypothetical protein
VPRQDKKRKLEDAPRVVQLGDTYLGPDNDPLVQQQRLDAKRKEILASGGDPSILVPGAGLVVYCIITCGGKCCVRCVGFCDHLQDPKPISLAFAMTNGTIEEEERIVAKDPPLPRYLRYLKAVVPPADSKWGLKLRQMDEEEQDESLFLSPTAFPVTDPSMSQARAGDSESTPVESLASPQHAGLSVSTTAATLMAFSKLKASKALKSNTSRLESPDGDFPLPHTPTASHRSNARRDAPETPTSRVSESRDDATLSPTELVLSKRKEKFHYSSNVASPITKADFARAMGPIQVTAALVSTT